MSALARLLTCIALAVLVGGVAQAWLWRVAPGEVAAVVNTQFAWALLLYAAGWCAALAWPRAAQVAGLVAGVLTGAVLIGSYYLCQAVADGTRSAADQFADGRGLAWVGATIAVGGGLGLLGAWTGLTAERPMRGSCASFSLALLLVAGPLALLVALGDRVADESRAAVPVVYTLVGLGLALAAARRAPLRPVVVGAVVAGVTAALGVGVLLLLLTRVLYVTF